jgi:hypothetical protein
MSQQSLDCRQLVPDHEHCPTLTPVVKLPGVVVAVVVRRLMSLQLQSIQAGSPLLHVERQVAQEASFS